MPHKKTTSADVTHNNMYSSMDSHDVSGSISTGDIFSVDDVQGIHKKPLYSGFYQMAEYKLQHRLFDGGWSNTIRRECMLRPVAVSVLAYDPVQDCVVLVRQFRVGAYASQEVTFENQAVSRPHRYAYPIQYPIANPNAEDEAAASSPWMLECVAGLMDASDKSAEQTARRELLEESGLKSDNFTLIYDVLTSAGGSSERSLLYYTEVDAKHAGGIHGVPGEGEDIQVICLPFSQVLNAMQRGRIRTAQCVSAMMWLQINHSRLVKKK